MFRITLLTACVLLVFPCDAVPKNGRHRYVGMPVAMLEKACTANAAHLSVTPFDNGKSRLYASDYLCEGQLQFWLLRAVDKHGNTLSYTERDSLVFKRFLIDDVVEIPELRRKNTPFVHGCSRNGSNIGPETGFAFATGSIIPLFDNAGNEIGYRATRVASAWKVNLQSRRFERIPTTGISCEYAP